MGFPIVLGPIGKVLLGGVAASVLGRGRGGNSLQQAGQAAQQEEANALRARNDLIAQIRNLIGDQAKGGRPPAFKLDLRNPMDIESFVSQLAPNAERNALMDLLSASGPQGTGLSQTALQQGTAIQNRKDQEQQALLALIGQFLARG